MQPEITDWRDLRVGDVVAFSGVDGEHFVVDIENHAARDDDSSPIKVSEAIAAECNVAGWVDIRVHPWRFIRPP